jgi:glycerol-3-phosphate dehydrogenase
MSKKTDVLIIGGGVGGTSIARELSKYDVDVTLVEREADVGWGQTKASWAICHPGARWAPGTLAQKLIAESYQILDQIIDELDIKFKRLGELILAFNEEDLGCLKIMKKQGEHIKVEGLEIIGKTEIKRLEPNANSSAIAALYMPTAGLFNPHELVFAFYENARDNGVDMLLCTEVTGVIPEKDKFIVETNQDEIQADYIVNAAGLFAEKVAKMAGSVGFTVTHPTKTSCLIIDKCIGDVVEHIVTGMVDPNKFTSFKLVMPTFDGNLLLYTSIPEPTKGIDDRAVENRIFDLTLESARLLVPDIDFERYIITSFSGPAARTEHGDFIIKAHEKHPEFINVAIPPPGITCSSVIGKRVAEILRNTGLSLIEKSNFNPYRKGIKSLQRSSPMEVGELVRQDPRYGRVVCHCEKVTEGEIVEAIHRGATTLDGVKFRTRAGMGRCQTNYCGPEVTSILARELGQPFESITKKGRGSNYINHKGS